MGEGGSLIDLVRVHSHFDPTEMRVKSLTLALALVMNGAAQSWCPPNASWQHSFSSAGVAGEQLYSHAGDTVIGTDTAQVIDLDFFYYFAPNNIFNYPAALITKETDGLVLTWNGDSATWDTLFWFSASIGDRWQRAHDYCEGADNYEVVLIDTVFLDGLPFRKLTLANWYWGQPYYYILTERIGVCNSFLFPLPCFMENAFVTLIDYTDDEITNVTQTELSCSVATNNQERFTRSPILYPNPGTDHFTLQLPPGQHDLMIFDTQGRLMLQQKVSEDRQVINASGLAKGLYNVQVLDQSGHVRVHRWVKQ
jgi:hypothetical protein